MTSPTSRTLARLKAAGIIAQTVEKWCSFSRRRIDLFGCLDIVCIRQNRIVGIQVTSGDNLASRIAKINAEPRALAWVQAGGSIEAHGWAKRGGRGKRKLWTCRVVRASVLPGGTQLVWEECD